MTDRLTATHDQPAATRLPALLAQLRAIVGDSGLVDDPASLFAYECDGFPIAKGVPVAVVYPRSTDEVAACLRAITAAGRSVIPRGSGTGLTGGSVAFDGGVIVCTSRMTRIEHIDIAGRWACVSGGVLNMALTRAVNATPGGEHLHFAPDPSSQAASTIAGNVATNAGGLHTLKYGVTANHILGLELVTPDGQVLTLRPGGMTESAGPNVAGLVSGSEGTLGLITRVWVRLTRRTTTFRTIVAIYHDTLDASRTVAEVIRSGIVPAAMELMDGVMVRVVEDTFHYGFPADAQAVLLIEIDGIEAALDEQMERVVKICRDHHADRVDCSADPARRAELWKARKGAFAAIGKVSPSYCTQDACVPRSRLVEVIAECQRIGKKYQLEVANVFHAGDGNVHPILMFDEHDPDSVRRTMEASHDILKFCIAIGGTPTGEHGVGVEKLPMMWEMFDPATIDAFKKVKAAFDPDEQMNVGKLIPSEKLFVDLLHIPINKNSPGGGM